MAKKVNVGLVGYKFMGKAHSNAYRDVAMFFDMDAEPVMKAVCGRDEEGVKAAAEKFGWDGYETSWETLAKRDDIDLIDVTAPSNFHKQISLGAIENGKHIFCEKPLALNLADAREMLQAAEEAGVKHMINFNYRTAPAVALAKRMVDDGLLGKIYHFRAVYLQDWIIDPDFPIVWRLDASVAGSGSHGDLNAHIIDIARFIVGEFDSVVGMSETFIKERPLTETGTTGGLKAEATGGMGKVTVDDATLFLTRFANGALGSFEATRFAAGRRNYNRFEVNGSKGSVVFNLERMNELEYYSCDDPEGLQGFRTIQATDSSHPYIDAWWPPAHIIGYEHTFIHQVYNLMQAIANDKMPSPSFVDGVKCQEVLDAVVKSVTEKRWVEISEM